MDCVSRVSSAPQLMGLVEAERFLFMISATNQAPCEAWILNNLARKLSDVENTISSVLEDSSCGPSVPCMANSHFTCGSDPSLINFE